MNTPCISCFQLPVVCAHSDPTQLDWTIYDQNTVMPAVFSLSASGDHGSYSASVSNGGNVDLHFDTCFFNNTGVPVTVRFTFNVTYAASASGLPQPPSAAGANIWDFVPNPAIVHIVGCSVLPPFGGSCGAGPVVATYDYTCAAFSSIPLRIMVSASASLPGPSSASISGTFIVTVF